MLIGLDLICVTESELLQWRSRGLMHVAADRVTSGLTNASLFALAPLLKIDDAKSRVIVNLGKNFGKSEALHPSFQNADVLSIFWSQIRSISPVIPQFKRRLEDFNLPIEEWDLTQLWDEWLVTQSCYERTEALRMVLGRLGFNSTEFVADALVLSAIVRTALRPGESTDPLPVPDGWRTLLQNRDGILKKLRFSGHCDRTSFLEASISELVRINGADPSGSVLEGFIEARESGWQFQDLSDQALQSLLKLSGASPFSMEEKVSLVFGAIYLRLFDELFYGQKNWRLCFNLLRFAKYSLDSRQADFLTAFLAASFPSEELRGLDLPTRFYSHSDGSENQEERVS